ncbi:MAG: type II toxin-antitoxin system VapC family toxin [Acidobacteriaceae bacterium]
MGPPASCGSEKPRNEILVSAASIYEISLKVRLGKLPEATEFEGDLPTNIEEKLGFVLLPLGPQSMYRAARFEDKHADPFDRMIAAQAIQHDVALLSADPRLDALGVRRVKRPANLRYPIVQGWCLDGPRCNPCKACISRRGSPRSFRVHARLERCDLPTRPAASSWRRSRRSAWLNWSPSVWRRKILCAEDR